MWKKPLKSLEKSNPSVSQWKTWDACCKHRHDPQVSKSVWWAGPPFAILLLCCCLHPTGLHGHPRQRINSLVHAGLRENSPPPKCSVIDSVCPTSPWNQGKIVRTLTYQHFQNHVQKRTFKIMLDILSTLTTPAGYWPSPCISPDPSGSNID